LKAVININEKLGANYGSFGAGCTFELEVAGTPDEILAQLRLQSAIAAQHVTNELDRRRTTIGQIENPKPHPPPREPGDDQADDDLRPGDPAFERNRPSDRGSYTGSDRDYDDQIDHEHERHDRGRGDRRDYRPAPERSNDRRPPPRNDDRGRDDRSRGGGGEPRRYPPPRNARMFCGWFQSLKDKGDEGKEIQREVYRLLEAWNLPKTIKDLRDDDAVAIYHEIMNVPAGGRSGGWGRNGDDRNGDGGRR
jgi:hypothetical protein